MIRKLLLLLLLAAAAVAVTVTVQSRGEITRYREIRKM